MRRPTLKVTGASAFDGRGWCPARRVAFFVSFWFYILPNLAYTSSDYLIKEITNPKV
jgi:hypothetical protein